MDRIVAGHSYILDHLKIESGGTNFNFHMDPLLHDGKSLSGPSCQEVLRMIIDRVKVLDEEKSHRFNKDILTHLRQALALFEWRSQEIKIYQNRLNIECANVNKEDGHIEYKGI